MRLSRKILSSHFTLVAIVWGSFFFLLACSGKKAVTSNGLSYIKIGDPFPKSGTTTLKNHILSDTSFVEGEYQWRGLTVHHKNGVVILEEDFFDNQELNRIRIQTPDLQMHKGLCVGKQISDLQKISGKWYVSTLPDYELFDFYSRKFPRIHFLVKDPSRKMDGSSWEDYPIEGFDPEAKIEMIVVY